MKRNTLLKSITISIALSALLAGCGSTTTAGSQSQNDTPQNQNIVEPSTISGKAIDGYLQYATVCLDLSKDGYCQNTEPTTQTDENGSFTLTITPEIEKNENFKTAMLLVYGGKDVDTGDDFKGKLLAPKDGSTIMVTPINTLIAKAVQKELEKYPEMTEEEILEKIQEHRRKVAETLEIPEDEINKDPVVLHQQGKSAAMQKTLQLQKAVEALLIADDEIAIDQDRTEKIYEALAEGMNDMQPDESGIDTLLEKTLTKAREDQKIKASLGGEEVLKLGDAAKKIAQNVEQRFQGFDEEEKRKPDFLQKIAAYTEVDLQKVKIAFDKNDTEQQIAGQITVDEQIFQYDFDWEMKYIENDLMRMGIENPSEDLIASIKELFSDQDEIKPGMVFAKKEYFKQSNDPELQILYPKIVRYLDKKREKTDWIHKKRPVENRPFNPGNSENPSSPQTEQQMIEDDPSNMTEPTPSDEETVTEENESTRDRSKEPSIETPIDNDTDDTLYDAPQQPTDNPATIEVDNQTNEEPVVQEESEDVTSSSDTETITDTSSQESTESTEESPAFANETSTQEETTTSQESTDTQNDTTDQESAATDSADTENLSHTEESSSSQNQSNSSTQSSSSGNSEESTNSPSF